MGTDDEDFYVPVPPISSWTMLVVHPSVIEELEYEILEAYRIIIEIEAILDGPIPMTETDTRRVFGRMRIIIDELKEKKG